MSKLKILFAFLASFLVAGLLSLASIFYLFQPVDSSSQEVKTFIIPKGQAVLIIAGRLEEEGLIRSALIFRLEVERKQLVDKLQAGFFELSPAMSVAEIAQELTRGTEDIWVTLLEGWRLEQIAESLDNQPLPMFDPAEFLELAQGKEGYLFPDTYLVPREITASQVLTLLESTFERKVVDDLTDDWSTGQLSLEDGIVLASLVEREAKNYQDKQRVAGILLNRLEIGMALQVDATLQYIKGYDDQLEEWWVAPLAEDKELDSLYNTYKYPGLPPYPIANPGLDSINAVLDPRDSDDLFYLHDRTGKMHYAQTAEEHNANVNKYLR